MRTITIRQLSINLFKELENLPVTVTRYGKVYCVITGPISQESQNTDKPVVTDLYSESIYAKEQMKKENTKLNRYLNSKLRKAVKEGADEQDALIRKVLTEEPKEKPFVQKRGELDIDNYV